MKHINVVSAVGPALFDSKGLSGFNERVPLVNMTKLSETVSESMESNIHRQNLSKRSSSDSREKVDYYIPRQRRPYPSQYPLLLWTLPLPLPQPFPFEPLLLNCQDYSIQLQIQPSIALKCSALPPSEGKGEILLNKFHAFPTPIN